MGERLSNEDAYNEAEKMQSMIEKGDASNYDEAERLLSELSIEIKQEQKGKLAKLLESLRKTFIDSIQETMTSANDQVFKGQTEKYQQEIQLRITKTDEAWAKMVRNIEIPIDDRHEKITQQAMEQISPDPKDIWAQEAVKQPIENTSSGTHRLDEDGNRVIQVIQNPLPKRVDTHKRTATGKPISPDKLALRQRVDGGTDEKRITPNDPIYWKK